MAAVGVWAVKGFTVDDRLWERVPRKEVEAELSRIGPALSDAPLALRISR